ncbi:FAD-dependent oxidoreductase [Mesorhizobium sp. PL10]
MQPALRDLVRNTDMAARIAAPTLRMLPGLGSPRVTDVYPGNRPMLSDRLPVAGRTAIEGLYVHGGMGSMGINTAPATARWLADAMLSGDGNPKQTWLRPQRFAGWEG